MYYTILSTITLCNIQINIKYVHTGNEKPKLKDLYDYVTVKYATCWKQLGRNLDIGEDLINIIKKDNPQNCEECCSKLLHDWLEVTPDATWGILLEAADRVQSAPDNPDGMYRKLKAVKIDKC